MPGLTQNERDSLETSPGDPSSSLEKRKALVRKRPRPCARGRALRRVHPLPEAHRFDVIGLGEHVEGGYAQETVAGLVELMGIPG